MGTIHQLDTECRHEGHVVGFAPYRWVPQGQATDIQNRRPVARLPQDYYSPGRELGTHEADDEYVIQGVRWASAGCSCGWRSAFQVLTPLAEWSPSLVLLPEHQHDRVMLPWRAHVELELGAASTPPISAADRARHAAVLAAFRDRQLTTGSDLERAITAAITLMEANARASR
jgi:hypothetical protein